jgi:hypothetical protein
VIEEGIRLDDVGSCRKYAMREENERKSSSA